MKYLNIFDRNPYIHGDHGDLFGNSKFGGIHLREIEAMLQMPLSWLICVEDYPVAT